MMEQNNTEPRIVWRFAFGVYVWLLLGLFILVSLPRKGMILGGVLLALLVVAIMMHIRIVLQRLRAHGIALQDFANVHNLWLEDAISKDSTPKGYIGSLGYFYRNDEIQILASIDQGDWMYREAACAPIVPIGPGVPKPLSIQYYGFMIVDLGDKKSLPNIFLANNPSKLRVGRIHFEQHQRIFVNAQLERYFKVYSPVAVNEDYSILDRTDVVKALGNASKYDVEIKANKLYVYGALSNPASQIPGMQSALFALRDALLA